MTTRRISRQQHLRGIFAAGADDQEVSQETTKKSPHRHRFDWEYQAGSGLAIRRRCYLCGEVQVKTRGRWTAATTTPKETTMSTTDTQTETTTTDETKQPTAAEKRAAAAAKKAEAAAKKKTATKTPAKKTAAKKTGRHFTPRSVLPDAAMPRLTKVEKAFADSPYQKQAVRYAAKALKVEAGLRATAPPLGELTKEMGQQIYDLLGIERKLAKTEPES